MTQKNDMQEFLQTLELLGDHQNLKRERAVSQLKTILKAQSSEETKSETSEVSQQMERQQVAIAYLKLMAKSRRWEDRYGAINGSLLLIEDAVSHNTVTDQMSDYMWGHVVEKTYPELLVDEEFRVRNQLASLIKAIIASDRNEQGLKCFERVKDMLLKNIQATFDRDGSGEDASGTLNVKVRPLISPDSMSGKTMHDSEGWKSLETSMRNLQSVIEAIGTQLYSFDLTQVLDVIKRAIAHLNRFVREISFFVINAIFETSVGVQKTEHYERFKAFCDDLIPLVSGGLADNWSQVRFASCLCARSFFMVLKELDEDDPMKEKYNNVLVPRMCLNRYYVAEGVRVYSLETWKQVFGDRGKQIVSKYADSISEFYVSQSQADNHAVREAACHCISELCSKVAVTDEAKDPFRNHITALLDTLVDCFKDESWPVRDAACVACGFFVASFPQESEPKYEELCKLWIDHLSDNIYSVRSNSAKALAKVYQSAEMYREDLYNRMSQYLQDNILKAKEQKAQSSKNTNLQNETQFGVAKPTSSEFENQTMYSCGSLAPKLKRGGGCMDHGFTRSTELWEMSDGCVFLVKELSMVRNEADASVVIKAQELICKHMESLADIGYIDHFKHASALKEHLFKALAMMVSTEGLGKKKFRGYVELMLDPVFRNTNHSSQNCAISAQDFLLEVNKVYGDSITKAIIENHDQKYLEEFLTIKEAQKMNAGEFAYPPFGSRMVPGGQPFPGANIPTGQPLPGAMAGGAFPVAKAPWAK